MNDDVPAHKDRPGKIRRLLRLIGATLDPRAWLHLVKLVNYYNYSHVRPLRKIVRGRSVNISPDAVFVNPSRITLGERVRIGSRCHLWAGPGSGRIIVGDDVLFGPEVMLTAATYRHEDGDPISEQAMREADIEIGSGAWLATRAIVLPGTRIGAGAIVAAGAVVKGDFAAGAIIAGSPAKVIGSRKVDPALN